MAGGSFTIQKDNEMHHGEVKRGTKIMGCSKEDQSGFLEERRLKNPVKKHYEFFGLPTNEGYASFYKSMSGDLEDQFTCEAFQRGERRARIVLQIYVWWWGGPRVREVFQCGMPFSSSTLYWSWHVAHPPMCFETKKKSSNNIKFVRPPSFHHG